MVQPTSAAVASEHQKEERVENEAGEKTQLLQAEMEEGRQTMQTTQVERQPSMPESETNAEVLGRAGSHILLVKIRILKTKKIIAFSFSSFLGTKRTSN